MKGIKMTKKFFLLVVSVLVGAAGFVLPTQPASAEVNVYTTPGQHVSSGRDWRTWCEDYSTDIQRCWTEIKSGGKWVFNNLTYLRSPKSLWANNPLARNGQWTSEGRRWKTSCFDEWTGPNACRSFILTDGKWVFNNIVAFGSPGPKVDTTWRPGDHSPGQSTAPSAPSKPKFSGFPDASNTGVPAGVTLRPSGSLTITTPGTVVDGLDIDGSINVQADNVTIRNSRVSTGDARYPIRVHPGVTGVLIEHVEVSNEGGSGKGIYFNSGSGTVRYSNIHSAEDGIFITADNVTVEYNYVHTLMRNAGAHPDAIQIRGGDNVTIRGNNLQAIHPQTGVSNAAIQIGSLVGDTITNFRVTDNLMNGGRFTINGGGRGEVDSAVYSGNKFGRDHQYGASGNIENSVWETSNVYADNGQPAR